MAAFCTKCGAGLSPDTKFCTKCGNPTAATPAAGSVTGGAAAQWNTPSAPPPAASGTTAPTPQPPAAAAWSTPSAPPAAPPAASSDFQPVSAPPPPIYSGFQPAGAPTTHAAPGFQPVSAPPPPPPPPPQPPPPGNAFSAPVPPPANSSFAPVAAPPRSFAPVAAPASTPPPYSGSPYPAAAQPPQKSGGALKIILIIVAILVLLVVLVIAGLGFAAWRISRAIHVSGNNGQVSIHTDQGNITAKGDDGLSASELGVALYPGSSVARGGMKMDLPTGTMATGIYTTPDSKDKVVAFYKSRLGSEVSTFDTGKGAVLSQKVTDRESIVITVEGDSSEYDGKTKYSIVHTTATKP